MNYFIISNYFPLSPMYVLFYVLFHSFQINCLQVQFPDLLTVSLAVSQSSHYLWCLTYHFIAAAVQCLSQLLVNPVTFLSCNLTAL